MSQNRKRKSNRNEQLNPKKVIRCRSRMSPVFEYDTCSKFVKKSGEISNNICMNCKHSF